ncbi:IgGFc-binding protein-like [Saccoglossus kowalevskii]|uniref:IgGFc-binding protein-like n=1 Tax=Saccoglossus kowalevskii TaxID=10224 RepID=A0ABM0GY68_SACKO|nr:PREDICTED: IgGFc-binding protein-like [Saccoglossus kowalevskii]
MIKIPKSLVLFGTSDPPTSNGIEITANEEVTVYVMNDVAFDSVDGYLALPVHVLGTEYYVVSSSISTIIAEQYRYSEFVVLGSHDNTTVTVNVTGDVSFNGKLYNKGDVVTFSLQTRETAQFQSGNFDLTGTHVTADKPFGLISGSKCTNIPTASQFCDHLVEQIPPVSAWGTTFVTTPLLGRFAGDVFRIVASRSNTFFNISGNYGNHTLDAGDFLEIDVPSTDSLLISSDRPLLVMQYSKGGEVDNTKSDPFMVLVVPFQQYSGSVTFATLNYTGGESGKDKITLDNHLNVNIKCDDITALNHNHQSILRNQLTWRLNVGGSDYCSAQLDIAHGLHTISHTDNKVKYSVVLHGWGSTVSYGFPVGMQVATLWCKRLTDDGDTEEYYCGPIEEDDWLDTRLLLGICIIVLIIVILIAIILIIGLSIYIHALKKRNETLHKKHKNAEAEKAVSI